MRPPARCIRVWLLLCLLSRPCAETAAATRKVNWVFPPVRVSRSKDGLNNTEWASVHRAALTGFYPCCGCWKALANGRFVNSGRCSGLSSYNLASANPNAEFIAEIQKERAMNLSVMPVGMFSDSWLLNQTWETEGSMESAVDLCRREGWSGLHVDNEDFVEDHHWDPQLPLRFAEMIGNLSSALDSAGLTLVLDVTSTWDHDIGDLHFMQEYARRGVGKRVRFMDMAEYFAHGAIKEGNRQQLLNLKRWMPDLTQVAPAVGLVENPGHENASCAGWPHGRPRCANFSDHACGCLNYGWNHSTLKAFVADVEALGFTEIDVYRQDADPPPGTTADPPQWFIDELAGFLNRGQQPRVHNVLNQTVKVFKSDDIGEGPSYLFGYTLMCPRLKIDGIGTMTVFEDLRSCSRGDIVYVDTHTQAELLRLPKRTEAMKVAESSCWSDIGLAKVLSSPRDELGVQQLAAQNASGGMHISMETIERLVPPIFGRSQVDDGQPDYSHTFIGSRISAEKIAFDTYGFIEGTQLQKSYWMPPTGANLSGSREGTVGGWLPATIFSQPYLSVGPLTNNETTPACTRGQNFLGSDVPGKNRIVQANMTASLCATMCMKNLNCVGFFVHDNSCSTGDNVRFCVLKAAIEALNNITNVNCTCGAQVERHSRSTIFTVERVSFADPEPASAFVQHPVWHRFLNVSYDGRLNSAAYINSYLPFPNRTEPAASDFYAALFLLHQYWQTALNTSLAAKAVSFRTAEQPEFLGVRGQFIAGDEFVDVRSTHADASLLVNMSRSSIVREMITRRGFFFPRYGTPPSHYGMDYNDGFQDIVNGAVVSALNLGLLGSASGYLSNYLEYFTLPGSRIVYRSPETAQFGRFLSTVARHYEVTGDGSLLLQHWGKLRDIASMLIAARQQALLLPQTDAGFGLIHGNDEADVLLGDKYSGANLPYFDASMEAWRGFIEIASAYATVGHKHGRGDLVSYSELLLREAVALAHDIDVALERSVFVDPLASNRSCLPYVAGLKSCVTVPQSLLPGCSNCHRESEPFRGFSGMYYSGFLTSRQAQIIAEYNLNAHGLARLGMWGAGSGFDNHMMTFTEVGHGFGLLQQGRTDEFLLMMFTTAKHCLSRGTFTAPESMSLKPPPWTPPGYASPAQQLLPQLFRWALVLEEKRFMTARRLTQNTSTDNTVDLHLARGIPRAWLAYGERLSVRNLPSSVGNVSYTLAWSDKQHLLGNVELVVGVATACRLGTISLYLRLPPSMAVTSVSLHNQPFAGYSTSSEAISFEGKNLQQGGRAEFVVAVKSD